MRRIKQAKPSAALVVAVVALVAALGGGAVAGVAVTSLSKKDKNQVRKISKKQAKKLDQKIELLPGPKGEPGPKGDVGPVGPTEGTATPAVTATRNVSKITGSFETTLAGRLLVTASLSRLNFACLVGSTFSAWLEVDDVAVPGSELPALPLATDLRGLSFTGVTAESIAAGQHTARVAVDCTSGPDSTSLSADSGGTSVVVLGG